MKSSPSAKRTSGMVEFASSYTPSIFAASTPTMSPYLVASAASPAGMSFQETFGVSALQYAGRHFEMPTHEQLYSPTTHFCSATGTPDQHSPREALIMSAVHQSGMGSSGSSSVFIRTGKSSSTIFFRRASRSPM